MITESDIHKFRCRYHRNGVQGDGFYSCQFTYGRGKAAVALRAIVFDADAPNEHLEWCVAVTSEDASVIDHEAWRGDEFAPALRRLCRAWSESRDAFRFPTEQIGVILLYLRREPTTDSLYLDSGERPKYDVAGYADTACTRPLIRWPWHAKAPRRSAKTAKIMDSELPCTWLTDAPEPGPGADVGARVPRGMPVLMGGRHGE